MAGPTLRCLSLFLAACPGPVLFVVLNSCDLPQHCRHAEQVTPTLMRPPEVSLSSDWVCLDRFDCNAVDTPLCCRNAEAEDESDAASAQEQGDFSQMKTTAKKLLVCLELQSSEILLHSIQYRGGMRSVSFKPCFHRLIYVNLSMMQTTETYRF